LFFRLLIVGLGEVEDGAFPSLAVGATTLLYDDLWADALNLNEGEAFKLIDHHMPKGTLLRKQFDKIYEDLNYQHFKKITEI
jgi:hypothetical protein